MTELLSFVFPLLFLPLVQFMMVHQLKLIPECPQNPTQGPELREKKKEDPLFLLNQANTSRFPEKQQLLPDPDPDQSRSKLKVVCQERLLQPAALLPLVDTLL